MILKNLVCDFRGVRCGMLLFSRTTRRRESIGESWNATSRSKEAERTCIDFGDGTSIRAVFLHNDFSAICFFFLSFIPWTFQPKDKGITNCLGHLSKRWTLIFAIFQRVKKNRNTWLAVRGKCQKHMGLSWFYLELRYLKIPWWTIIFHVNMSFFLGVHIPFPDASLPAGAAMLGHAEPCGRWSGLGSKARDEGGSFEDGLVAVGICRF